MKSKVDSKDYFTCTRFRCSMPIATCIARQKKKGKHDEDSFQECIGCAQGVMVASGEWKIISPLPAILTSEKEETQTKDSQLPKAEQMLDSKERENIMTTAGEKKQCNNCGRVKAIQARGKCGLCNAAIKGLVEGSDEYIKTLADAKARALSGNPMKRDRKAMTVKATQPSPGRTVKGRKDIDPLQSMKLGDVSPELTIIPVKLQLSIEIDVRVMGISTGILAA